jgi:hypothetical protein
MLDIKHAFVLGRQGGRVGMAFVVSPSHLVTCAHVVAVALGRESDKFEEIKPVFPVTLQFFETGTTLAKAPAKVVVWRRCIRPDDEIATPDDRETSDIALMELDTADVARLAGPQFAARLRPVKLLEQTNLRSELPFTVVGSRAGGVLGAAVLGGKFGARWIVLQKKNGARIEDGFSGGAAVADEEEGISSVIGMIARAHNVEDQAQLIPAATLSRVLIANNIKIAAGRTESLRGPLLASLRLPIDDLYVLKDRNEAVGEIQEALFARPVALPVFLADCDPLTDALDGLIRRLSYELARHFKLSAPLEILDLAVPEDTDSDIDRLVHRHEQDVSEWLGLDPPKDPLASAVLRFHALHLRDVDLKSDRGIALTVSLLRNWAKASGSDKKMPPFFVLLTTAEPHDHLMQRNFAAALAERRETELHELGRLGPVKRNQLRRWAREANFHLPRPVRETAVIERNAQRLIYSEQEQMSMMDWFERFLEHQPNLFGYR